MSNDNGSSKTHPFFGTQAFEPVWHYFRCSKCRRTLVCVSTSRGDIPPKIKCPQVPGSALVGGTPCPGDLQINEERRMRDWPVFTRHEPDVEWFKPGNDELKKIKRAAPKLWEYIQQGGLIMRSPKGHFPWPLAGPRVPHEPIALPPVEGPACPSCGNALDENNRCAIHGDPNDHPDPGNILIQ